MDLSIIIVNWRSVEYLRLCISSIYKHTVGISYEIVVIDNASGDGVEDIIRNEFPKVIFILSSHNIGFAKANNLAYALTSGDILVFLNPDTELNHNAFALMVAHLREHASAGAVGARLLNTDGSLQT